VTLINLPDPKPRSNYLDLPKLQYRIRSKQYLDFPTTEPNTSLFTTLRQRRSRKHFGSLAPGELEGLLFHSCKTFEMRQSARGYTWQHRATPSAGGIHPIDVLIFMEGGQVALYDNLAHALLYLDIEPSHAESLGRYAEQILPLQNGCLIWLVGHFYRTLAAYEHPETLVWRDAGILLATLALVAEGLSLNCCLVGGTGEPMISTLLAANEGVFGVGGIVVGAKEDRTE
jgi:hypothetical protein